MVIKGKPINHITLANGRDVFFFFNKVFKNLVFEIVKFNLFLCKKC